LLLAHVLDDLVSTRDRLANEVANKDLRLTGCRIRHRAVRPHYRLVALTVVC